MISIEGRPKITVDKGTVTVLDIRIFLKQIHAVLQMCKCAATSDHMKVIKSRRDSRS
jgi:hypothetical protein